MTFELSITNVDKPPLDFIEIADRLEAIGRPAGAADSRADVCRKGAAGPGLRVRRRRRHDRAHRRPSYYGGDRPSATRRSPKSPSDGCRFLVFGRTVEDDFAPLSAVKFRRRFARCATKCQNRNSAPMFHPRNCAADVNAIAPTLRLTVFEQLLQAECMPRLYSNAIRNCSRCSTFDIESSPRLRASA